MGIQTIPSSGFYRETMFGVRQFRVISSAKECGLGASNQRPNKPFKISTGVIFSSFFGACRP